MTTTTTTQALPSCCKVARDMGGSKCPICRRTIPKIAAAIVLAIALAACTDDGSAVGPDANTCPVEVDASTPDETQALGYWYLVIDTSACTPDTRILFALRLTGTPDMPRVSGGRYDNATPQLAMATAGADLVEGGASVWIVDTERGEWTVELTDDGTTASAHVAYRLGLCQVSGDATISNRVRL